jgi:hypothetical protein
MICQSFGIIWVFVVLINCFSIGFVMRTDRLLRKKLLLLDQGIQAAKEQREIWRRMAERLQ